MSAEQFPGIRQLPVLTEIPTKKLADVRYSPNLLVFDLAGDIRFNYQLAVGGAINIDQCQFETSGLLMQTVDTSELEIKNSTAQIGKLEAYLPEAVKLAKGRKRFLFFTYGKTPEEKSAQKNKKATVKRHNKERKSAEKQISQKNQEIQRFARKNGITEHQKTLFDRMISVQDFLNNRSKRIRHRRFKQIKDAVKADLKVLNLPFGLRLKRSFDRLETDAKLFIPQYPEYLNLIRGVEKNGQRMLGLKDYESQLDEVVARQKKELAKVDGLVQEANRRANLAEEMKQQIKFHTNRLANLQVLISRLMVSKHFLSRVYVQDGVVTLHERLQQAKNDLAQLRDAQGLRSRMFSSVGARDEEGIAIATSRVKDLEKKLEIAINPLRRLNQDDVPKDIKEAVQRVSSRKYDPTKVSETQRVFDDLVLVLTGRKTALVSADHSQEEVLKNAA